MRCKNCGTEHNANYCPNCRAPAYAQNTQQPEYQQQYQPNQSKKAGRKCPRCSGNDITYQVVTDTKTKHRGCFGWMGCDGVS